MGKIVNTYNNESENHSEQALKLATKPTKFNTGCTLVFNTIMLIFFSIYSFANPDQSQCFARCSKGVHNLFNQDCMAFDKYHENYIDVKHEFRITFITGFVLSIVNLLYACVCIMYFIWERQTLLRTASCCVIISFILTVSWMVYASIVIFSKSGQECMQTYLPKSGSFIFIWLIIVYVCLGFCLCVFCMLCSIMTCKAKSNSSQEEDPLEERIVNPYR